MYSRAWYATCFRRFVSCLLLRNFFQTPCLTLGLVSCIPCSPLWKHGVGMLTTSHEPFSMSPSEGLLPPIAGRWHLPSSCSAPAVVARGMPRMHRDQRTCTWRFVSALSRLQLPCRGQPRGMGDCKEWSCSIRWGRIRALSRRHTPGWLARLVSAGLGSRFVSRRPLSV